MSRRRSDLTIVIALALGALALTLLPGIPALLRAPAALALVLALPGYALVAALDVERTSGAVERAVLSLGTSIGLTILCGLVLNVTPWGLRREPWALLLAALSVGAALVAIRRRGTTDPAPRTERPGRPAVRMRPAQAVLLAVTALALAGTVGIARLGAAAQPTAGFTQLWMQQVDDQRPNMVLLGISNQEDEPMRYLLRVTIGERLLAEWPNIELQPGARWEITEALPVSSGSTQPVEATLYRQDAADTPYRHTTLWLTTRSGGQ